MILGLLTTVLTLAPAEISVRVEGEGYFRLIRDGRAVYAKEATFGASSGKLAAKGGVQTLPAIELPKGAGSLTVGEDGTVRIQSATVGKLMLARFAEGSFLVPEKGYLIARDRPVLGYAGTEGFGKIVSINEERRTINEKSIPASLGIHNPKPKVQNPLPITSEVRVTIPAEATIEGSRITLGEIATIEGNELLKNLDLGNSPVHGVPTIYSRERILSRLAAQGYDRKNFVLDMPATVRVRRASQIVTPEQLVERGKAAILEKIGLEGELTTEDRQAEIEAPKGELTIAVESISLGRGTASVTLGIRVDGKRFHGRTIRFAGELLEPAVDAGSTVNVRFVANGVVIEVSGRARSAGMVGQTVDVSVTNAETRETTTHPAVIVGRGKVEVRL